MLNRDKELRRLGDERFDLVVVGGGISGACLAYDAALRGLRVTLVEKGDFGGATSSASSKVLHGGIRYLQSLRIDKVRESALERMYFQNLAPHLCRYVPFLVPAFRGLTMGRIALKTALLAYTMVSLGQNRRARHDDSRVPQSWSVDSEQLLEFAPWLKSRDDLRGGIVLPECHMLSSERMTLEFIGGAVANGGAAVNYAEAVEVGTANGRVRSVRIRDGIGGNEIDIRTRLVANCAGPWIGLFNGSALKRTRGPVTAMSRGSHAVLRGLKLPCAIGLPTDYKIEGVAGRGGRHIFMIPWRDHVLLGTSYSSHDGSLDVVEPTVEDIRQLLGGLNRAVGRDLVGPENIVHAFAGLYPLTTETVRSGVYQGTGDYEVIDHAKTDGVSGYFSVFGAKFTTARRLAENACDRLAASLGRDVGPCLTRTEPVPGGSFVSFSGLVTDLLDEYGGIVERERIEPLARLYGVNAKAVLGLVRDRPELGYSLASDRETIQAEAVYCARTEMVCRLEDFIFRRTGLGTTGNPGLDAVKTSAALIGTELDWSQEKSDAEVEHVASRFARLDEIRNAL